MILLLTIVLLLAVLCLIKKRNKIVGFLFLCILILLFCGRMDGADLLNYQLNYSYTNHFSWMGWEPLYQLFILICKKIGMDFNLFQFVYAIIGIRLIYLVYYRFAGQYNAAMVLYFIYPFFFDVVQIRSFLSTAIILFSVPWLLEDNWKGNLKYSIGVVLATGFHYSAIIYFIFLVIRIMHKKYTSVICFFSAGLFYILLQNIYLFSGVLPAQIIRKLSYLEGNVKWYSKIIIFTYLLATCYMLSRMMKVSIKQVGVKEYELCEIILKLNYIMFVFFPLLISDISFLRLQRIIAMLNYIVFFTLKYKNEKTKKQMRFIGISYAIVSFIIFIAYSNFEGVVAPIFVTNKWFN